MKKAGAGAVPHRKGLAVAAALIASLVVALVPVAARAQDGAIRSCAPSDRWFTQSLRARGVPCRQARGIEHYSTHHDWTPKFRLYGRTWHAMVYKDAAGRTHYRFRSGRRIVWLSATGGGLALGSGSGTEAGSPGQLSPPQLQPLGTVTSEQQLPVPVSGPGVAAGQYVLLGATASMIEADANGQLSFLLPRDVPPGPTPVRLAAAAKPSGAPTPIPGSPIRTLRVRPDVADVRSVNNGATVRVQVLPFINPPQSVVLSLFSLDSQGLAISVASAPRARPRATLDFPLPTSLPAGTYLCTIDVDGITSLPTFAGGVFSGPTVTIP